MPTQVANHGGERPLCRDAALAQPPWGFLSAGSEEQHPLWTELLSKSGMHPQIQVAPFPAFLLAHSHKICLLIGGYVATSQKPMFMYKFPAAFSPSLSNLLLLWCTSLPRLPALPKFIGMPGGPLS